MENGICAPVINYNINEYKLFYYYLGSVKN